MESSDLFQVTAIGEKRHDEGRQLKRIEAQIPEFKPKPQPNDFSSLLIPYSTNKRKVQPNSSTDFQKKTATFQAGSSGTIYDDSLDALAADSSDIDAPQGRLSVYSINAYQKLMCEFSGLGGQPAQSAPAYISTAFQFDAQLSIYHYKKVIHTLVDKYLILNTEFYVNPKIIDADVEARIVLKELMVSVQLLGDPKIVSLNDRLQNAADSWIGDRFQIDSAFKILLVESTGDREAPSAVIAVSSKALLDMSSLLHILDEAHLLYSQIRFMSDTESTEYLANYQVDEDEDAFMNLSTAETFNVKSEPSVKFWRLQYVEYTHTILDERNRSKLERKERDSDYRHDRIKNELDKLTARKTYLDEELVIERAKRKEYEQISFGKSSSYYDFTSGRVQSITPEAIYNFTKTFLKKSVDVILVSDILQRYNLRDELVESTCDKFPTFESFLEMSETSSLTISKIESECRKVLVASEACRNFILEAHFGHGKNKFMIERHISKLGRELIACVASLKQKQRDLIRAGEESMSIRAALNPPVNKFNIYPLTLDFKATSRQSDSLTLHDSIVFDIPEESFLRMQEYHSSAFKQSSSIKKEALELTAAPLEIYERLGMAALGLSSVAILLRHVTGKTKFIIGFGMKLSFCRMRVGPLSPVVPIKIDLSDGNQTLEKFVSKLHARLCQAYHYASSFPYERYEDELCPEQMNVLFEYVGANEGHLYENESIMFLSDSSEIYDLKVSARQSNSQMKFAMRYRNAHISEAQVERWSDRILSTLESIDYNQRKMTIASFVTRFYNEIWMSKSAISLEAISMRTSSLSLSNLSV